MINVLPTFEINILDIRVFSMISPEVTVDCRKCSPAFVFLMHFFLWQGPQLAKTGMPARISAGIAPQNFTLNSIEKNALLFFHIHVHMSQKQHFSKAQFNGSQFHKSNFTKAAISWSLQPSYTSFASLRRCCVLVFSSRFFCLHTWAILMAT